MSDLIFDTPWWLPALIAGVGVFLFFTGNQRQERKVRIAGGAFVLAALLLLGVSYFVDTPREKAIKSTRQLVAAVAGGQWETMRSILHPNCTFAFYNNREEIVSAAEAATKNVGLKSIKITSLEAERTQSLITVTLSVVSEQDITMGRPFPTSWQLGYQKTANGWSIRNIEVLENTKQPGSQEAVKQNLPSVIRELPKTN